MSPLLPVSWLVACTPPPEGLRPTPDGDGPVVRVDWDAEPLPDIPFPNDLATRPDPTSPTGLRPNLPLDAELDLENETRATLNTLSGFGVFAPITVAFDGDLDLDALLARHPDDHEDPDAFRDDAVYVIDVEPSSPDFGRPVALDLGGGRFPQDATRLGTFLENDPRLAEPSLLFETGEEDLDGDGVLDDGEDTDGDGLLDHPNVWPPGGDHRADLLTFYDLQSDTLFLRPILPLREGTRYAVVLTSALVDADGAPVRSPWEWVNHTRQTAALAPVVSALEDLGRDTDDIAFAWTFTTGDVTGELWDLTDGLRGNGPFAWLAEDYPAGVTEGHHLHTTEGSDPMSLPVAQLLAPLATIGFIPPESLDILDDAYTGFASTVVGGVFVSPNLLVDDDDGGTDDSDEHFRIDRFAHTLVAAPQRIAFTCILPRAGDGIAPPWPIAIHAHGYGSTRVEFVGFAHALNRHGIAVCGIDAPGHGLPLGPDEQELVGALLDASGTEPLWWHLLEDRRRDLDNDGLLDSAPDMFTADPFHTRDMLRQGIVDQAQLMRSLRACGTGTMERVIPTAAGPVYTGEQIPSCDFDGDGTADLGGPDTRFVMEGISLGGIMTAVSIAVNDADTAVLTVPGGGLADIGGRTDIGAVAYAMIGRALSPLIIGTPSPDGLQISEIVISADDDVTLPIGTLPEIPAGGRVIVRNLDSGREESGWIPADGRFRVPMAANALDPAGKRQATGMPETGPGTGTYGVPDNAGIGDRLEIEIRDAAGETVAVLDTFETAVVSEGVTFEAGSPVVAGSWGLGLRRGSSALQRVIGSLAIGIEGADPIVYARRWADAPFRDPKNVLIHLTAGDTTVPEATGISLARAAGIVDFDTVDPRYGTTPDRWLVEHGVVQGLEEFWPYTGTNGQSVLFDPDDLDEGTDGTGAPSEEPLRAERAIAGGVHGLRFLYVEPQGTHAYFLPDESQAFDWELFGANQMAQFLADGGTEIVDDPCLATRDCPFLRPFPVEAE